MKRIALSMLLAFACQAGAPTGTDQAALLGRNPFPVPPRAQPMTGTITVWGCSPLPSEMQLTLYSTAGIVPDANGQLPPPPPTDEDGNPFSRGRTAQISTTQDPHVYAFRFEAVKTNRLYRVGMKMDSQRCPKTVWRGPQRGYVFGGDTRPLNVEGFAMRTQTEVLAMRGQNPIWVGVDKLDFDPQRSQRIFRWRTDVPGAVAGQVQIATKRFPLGAQAQQNPPQLLASFNAPLNPQGWAELPPIDFNQLGPTQCDPQNPNQCTPSLGPMGLEIRAGLPLFVRVVPVDAGGRPVPETTDGGTASWVKVAKVHLPDDLIPAPPPPPPQPPLQFQIWSDLGQPEKELLIGGHCYVVTDDHYLAPDVRFSYSDPWGWMAANYGGASPDTTLHPGYFFCIHSDGGGILDGFVDAVSGFFDAISDAVDYVAKLYSEIKEKVIEVVAGIITDLTGCESICEGLVEYAVDAGLAAMGLPPSLPNWNQLVNEGIDYLAEEAAEEAGGYVDKDTVKAFIHTVIEKMKHSGGSLAPWLTEDDGFRTPQFNMILTKNPAYTGDTPTLLHIPADQYHLGADVAIPAQLLDAGGSVFIPVQLLPNFSLVTPPRGCLCFTGTSLCDSAAPGCTCGVICLDAEGKALQDYMEDQWFYTVYASTPCTQVAADARVRAIVPGAGTAFDLEFLGMQMNVGYPTASPPTYYSRFFDPYESSCP